MSELPSCMLVLMTNKKARIFHDSGFLMQSERDYLRRRYAVEPSLDVYPPGQLGTTTVDVLYSYTTLPLRYIMEDEHNSNSWRSAAESRSYPPQFTSSCCRS